MSKRERLTEQPSFSYWNDLPVEIRGNVLRNITNAKDMLNLFAVNGNVNALTQTFCTGNFTNLSVYFDWDIYGQSGTRTAMTTSSNLQIENDACYDKCRQAGNMARCVTFCDT